MQPYAAPHPEGAPTISRAIAIVSMSFVTLSSALFALLFLLETLGLRYFNLYALFITYIIIPVVFFLAAGISLFLDYYYRTKDVFERQSAYFAMLVNPRYVWWLFQWVVVTILAILVSVAKVASFWQYAVGTSINPPYNSPTLLADSENMRYFNMTFSTTIYNIIICIFTVRFLHVYGLKTEQPTSILDIKRWISTIGGDPDKILVLDQGTNGFHEKRIN